MKELMIKDTVGCKEMMLMNHGNFRKRWVLRVRGLNRLSVAVQSALDIIESRMGDREIKEMLSRVERKV